MEKELQIINGSNYRLYIMDVSGLEDEDRYNELYRSVSDRRKNKTDRLRFRKDKLLSLGAEYLLMQACRDFDIDYSHEDIIENEHSKPYFKNANCYFSLSHSGTKAMCIMSGREVGCDVEKCDRANIEIADRFFNAKEKMVLDAIDNQKEKKDMFYRIWTLKESFVKCIGKGMSYAFDSFAIDCTGDRVRPEDVPFADSYELGELDNNDGYRYSWCIRQHDIG